MDQTEKDHIAFMAYVDLWRSENTIKTNKLLGLLFVNGLLASALQIVPGFSVAKWPVFAAGAIISAVACMSIGRTCLFQKVWQAKATALSINHRGDPRFELLETEAVESAAPRWLRVCGSVSSKYYLVGAPVFFLLVWTVGLIWIVVR